MLMTSPSDHLVTIHARVRWLERVEGCSEDAFNLRLIGMDDLGVLDELMRRYGFEANDLTRRILTPRCRQAMRLGAVRYTDNDATRHIRAGVITTITTMSRGRLWRYQPMAAAA